MFDPSQPLAELLEQDGRYKFEAYVFVFEALRFAQEALDMGTESLSEPIENAIEQEEDEPEGPQQHVSGQELCQAIRQYALQEYGYMAKTVLNSWGVHTTGDFGDIVFNLIRFGRMRKTAEDRREDFDDVYDFEIAFKEEFQIMPPD